MKVTRYVLSSIKIIRGGVPNQQCNGIAYVYWFQLRYWGIKHYPFKYSTTYDTNNKIPFFAMVRLCLSWSKPYSKENTYHYDSYCNFKTIGVLGPIRNYSFGLRPRSLVWSPEHVRKACAIVKTTGGAKLAWAKAEAVISKRAKDAMFENKQVVEKWNNETVKQFVRGG